MRRGPGGAAATGIAAEAAILATAIGEAHAAHSNATPIAA
jgi:hypothetical protein